MHPRPIGAGPVELGGDLARGGDAVAALLRVAQPLEARTGVAPVRPVRQHAEVGLQAADAVLLAAVIEGLGAIEVGAHLVFPRAVRVAEQVAIGGAEAIVDRVAEARGPVVGVVARRGDEGRGLAARGPEGEQRGEGGALHSLAPASRRRGQNWHSVGAVASLSAMKLS